MKKLRSKIVLGVFISATIVFLMTILFLSLSAQLNINNKADETTEFIGKQNGVLPLFNEYKQLDEDERIRMYSYDAESPFRFRYFVVRNNDNSYSVELEHIASVDENEAIKMASLVLNDNKSIGYLKDFRYRITDDSEMVIFLDCSDEISSQKNLILMFSLISLMIVILITVVFYFLSKIIVRPFEENSHMQKQFITDASHELKTPLAIISANAEVLAYKNGENEWINNITSQITRISELVGELLTLNRLEEVDEVTDIKAVNLSEIMNRTADEFEEVLKSKGITLSRKIPPDIIVNGNPSQLERLISVLTENASKYASENGEVIISLTKNSRFTEISVFNTCYIDPKTDFKHLFDRFYRPDSSRTSKTGGHGIGLSIAKRIVTLHNGSIEAAPAENGIIFKARISSRLKVLHTK